jgi:glycosyltransferase involved in cell wall biosynthesis
MISYYYPPLGGIGSQRSQKFARYLPDHGWSPTVLTPENGGSCPLDPSLDDGSGRGVEIVRTPVVDLSSFLKRLVGRPGANGAQPESPPGTSRKGRATREASRNLLRRAIHTWLYIPDAQIGWFPHAVRAARQVCERGTVDTIFSSSFPITSHLVARRLKAITKKPWVADFRDLWTEHHYTEDTNAMRKRLNQLIESTILDQADAIVTVSHTWAEVLKRLTGGRKRVEVIRNGFDGNDFAGVECERGPKWVVTYVGLFYGKKQSPLPLFTALKNSIGDGKIAKSDVQMTFVGEPDSFVENMVVAFGFQDIARFTGFVSHDESLRIQVNSSLLWLILHENISNSGHIPGKLYEYIGSRTPILAILPSDYEAASITREANAGVVVDAADFEGIESCLVRSYTKFKGGILDRIQETGLSPYDRRHGAGQLARLLGELADEVRVC